MKINLKGTGLEVTSEISDYLYKRLSGIEKFLPKGEGDEYVADVELAKTTNHHQAGDIFKAEISIFIGSRCYRAVSEKVDLHSAIDDIKDEVSRELGSSKGKKISLIRRSGQKFKQLLKRFYK